MPIRFRCVYCNQLLGISRRKAGTIVRCTHCEGQLIVPEPSEAHVAMSPGNSGRAPAPVGPSPPLFERSDFDDLLKPFAAESRPAALAEPPAALPRQDKPIPAPPVIPKAVAEPQPALMLTRSRLTVLCVVAVCTLGLVFLAGLLLGLSIRPAP